ncbi:decarboxylase family protein [Staphylococcus microti]|uniref:Decarboxylase family protein n=1 Tax=Staphylococcus microti TaxID=569857 RepID=A0A380GUA1_9STAP|nr:decarboxylase family protein [Staphylococcus microti]
MRHELKPFVNKKMTVQGVVTKVFIKHKIYMNEPYKRIVRILLRNVKIGGVQLDHIWLYERKKNYEYFQSLIGEEVKFKAVITPYVKKKNGLFIEDYGITKQSKVLPVDLYQKKMEQMHKLNRSNDVIEDNINKGADFMTIKRIAVYCGASKGKDPQYVEAAYALGKYFAEQDIELVFGAGSVGIMGAIQDGVLDHGGKAIGVMPKLLDEREITSQKVSELILVDSMHERKQKMSELADAFVIAPGGAGSLEEFFEVYSWAQIGLHQKPIGIYNINRFYDPLQQLIQHMIDEGFIDAKYKNLAQLFDTPDALLFGLSQAEPISTRTYD